MKKEEERWALDRFLALLPQSSPETIESGEEPDFVLGTGLCRIGVEMTDLYWPHRQGKRPRQEQESLRRRVAKLAEQLYEHRDLPAVYVSVHFDRQIGLDKRNCPATGQAHCRVDGLQHSTARWAIRGGERPTEPRLPPDPHKRHACPPLRLDEAFKVFSPGRGFSTSADDHRRAAPDRSQAWAILGLPQEVRRRLACRQRQRRSAIDDVRGR